jgi:hypothetical protein
VFEASSEDACMHAKIVLKILCVKTANELGEVMAVVDSVQNLRAFMHSNGKIRLNYAVVCSKLGF